MTTGPTATDTLPGFFARPFGFSGQASMAEYRPKALTAMTLTYAPLFTMVAIGDINASPNAYVIAAGVLLFALVYQIVWFVPLMVRRGRAAGIHWAASLFAGLFLTLIFAILLMFLPGLTKDE